VGAMQPQPATVNIAVACVKELDKAMANPVGRVTPDRSPGRSSSTRASRLYLRQAQCRSGRVCASPDGCSTSDRGRADLLPGARREDLSLKSREPTSVLCGRKMLRYHSLSSRLGTRAMNFSRCCYEPLRPECVRSAT
jgi:hypothetical protein